MIFQNLSEFADFLIDLQDQIGFKVSSRGWAYILEQKRYINKDQFDQVTNRINVCRKKGYLPIDFTAEESARAFSGVEEPADIDVIEEFGIWLEQSLEAADYYKPDWWEGETYYIQMVVEKIDLVTLFSPVCEQYHIPIANSKGWSSMLQRAEYARRFAEAEDKGLQAVLLYCIPEDEIIQKRDGFTSIQNIETGEFIFGESGLVKVINKYERSYIGELITFDAVGILPFSVTLEHPIKVANIEKYKHPKDDIYRRLISEDFVKAEDISDNNYFKVNIPEFHENIQFIELEYKMKNSNKIPKIIKDKNGIIQINPEISRMLGFYLGNGSYSGCPTLSFNKKDIGLIKEYKDIIEIELGYECNINDSQTCSQLKFGGNVLGLWLIDNFGKYAIMKKLPHFIFELPYDCLKEFIRGYIDSDGNIDVVRTRISTASKGLALQFQSLILVRYKELVSLFHQKREGEITIGGRKVYQHDKYEIHISQQTFCKIFDLEYHKKIGRRKWFIENNHLYTPITKIIKKSFEGKVYNFTTSDHTISINNIVTHNCGDHDPDGLRISEFLRKNLKDLQFVNWDDGQPGYDPENLIIDRFGLNYDFIIKNGFTWIDNLITGSGRDLASPSHRNFKMPYVQEYLQTIGERKCEANAIVTNPDLAQELCKSAIEYYLKPGAIERLQQKKEQAKAELDDFLYESGSEESIRSILETIRKRRDD